MKKNTLLLLVLAGCVKANDLENLASALKELVGPYGHITLKQQPVRVKREKRISGKNDILTIAGPEELFSKGLDFFKQFMQQHSVDVDARYLYNPELEDGIHKGLNVSPKKGWTKQPNSFWGPLIHAAVHFGSKPILKYLVKHQADLCKENLKGELAVDLAWRSNNLDFFRFLFLNGICAPKGKELYLNAEWGFDCLSSTLKCNT